MKINPLDHTIPLQPSPEKKTDKAESPDGKSFQSVFNETLGVEKASKSKKMMTATPLYGLSPVEKVISPEKESVIQRVDQLLNVLDHYRKRLDDGSISLKALGEDIQRLDDAKKQLIPQLEHIGDRDALKGIANEAMIIVTMEIERFKTGYYV